MPLVFILYAQTASAEETDKLNSSAIIFGSMLLGTQNLYLYYYTFISYCFKWSLNLLQLIY